MNYTDSETRHTRIIEHKHFENSISDVSWVTWEYPEEYNRHKEPYYTVNDLQNNLLYEKYKSRAESEGVYFGGRLAEYKYYNMDQVISSALKFVNKLTIEN